ncbi:hypothetical protein WJX84_011952 [Apatococcus fuscideae]|uniref:Uncharacterized protein n=1 Tax=Apatococcus fuscideae TaxID=2026836 RepID=A0AAW1TCN0_9CHLO
MNERFCRASLSHNVACAPTAAAQALRKFTGQDPDIDTTTLGNLEAAAAALDELSGWFLATSASGDAKPDRNHTRPVAASATDQGAKQKDKKSEKRRAEHEAGQPHAAATEETHPAGAQRVTDGDSLTDPKDKRNKQKKLKSEKESKKKKKKKKKLKANEENR